MRTISNHQIERRQAMAKAQFDITTAMLGHSLTAMEWAAVLNECQKRMIGYGLRDEWSEVENRPVAVGPDAER